MNTTFTTLRSTRGLLLFLLMLLLGSSQTWAQTSTNFDVVSIKRYRPLDQAVEYVAMFKVVFSGYIEDNTGRELGESDFRLITTGTATGTFATILTNGNNAYVAVKDMSGTGSLGIEYTGPTKSVYTGGETYEIVDKRPAVVSITRRNEEKLWGGNAYPQYLVIFSEPVTGVDAADFGVALDNTYATIYLVEDANGSNYPEFFDNNRLLGDFAHREGSQYIVTVGPVLGEGTLRLDVNATGTGIADVSGNNPLDGGFTAGESYYFDGVSPAVVSINRQAPATAVSSPGSVTFRVTFSEAVQGVDADDFGLVATGTVAGYRIGTIAAVSASVYDVTVNGITGEGSLRLKIWPGYSRTDLEINRYGSFEAAILILTRFYVIRYGGMATIYDFSSDLLRLTNPLERFDVNSTEGETYTISSAPPVASINPITAGLSCITPSVTLTASAGDAYLWSTGETTATIGVTAPGTYSVTVTTNGRTAEASAEVTGSTQAPTAGINPGAATLSCTNPSVSLTASGGVSYRWEDNSTSATRSVGTAGTYSVTVTAANGCTASAQITVTGDAADGLTTYFADGDGDGFGALNSPTTVCASTPPAGFVANSTDCDDTRKRYADGDGDGFGAGPAVACGVTTDTDCNDGDKTVNTTQTYYADADGDGFGNLTATTKVCASTPPTGFVTNSTDCDDARKLYADGDRDGFGAGVAVACGVATHTDCNDNNAAITPTTITSQPAGLSVVEKQTASLSVAATGTNLTYQWYFNGTTAAHALKKGTAAVLTLKGAKLSFKEAKPTDAGIYYVRVTGSCSSVLSVGAKLTVTSNRARVAAAEEGEPSRHLAVQAWPNPTTGRLQVRVTGAGEQPSVTLRLYTLMQRVAGAWTIPLENGEGEQTIDIGKASEGIYILAVEGEQNRVIRKVIKSN